MWGATIYRLPHLPWCVNWSVKSRPACDRPYGTSTEFHLYIALLHYPVPFFELTWLCIPQSNPVDNEIGRVYRDIISVAVSLQRAFTLDKRHILVRTSKVGIKMNLISFPLLVSHLLYFELTRLFFSIPTLNPLLPLLSLPWSPPMTPLRQSLHYRYAYLDYCPAYWLTDLLPGWLALWLAVWFVASSRMILYVYWFTR